MEKMMDLMDEQLKLESNFKQDGYYALLASVQQAKEKKMIDTATKVGKHFFAYRVHDLKQAVHEWIIKALTPHGGVKSAYIQLVYDMEQAFKTNKGDVDTELIADICTSVSLSQILNALAIYQPNNSATITALCDVGKLVSESIQYEYICKCFENWLKTQGKNIGALAGIDKRVGNHYRTVYLMQAMKKCGYIPKKWTDEETATSFGVALTAIAAQVLGYFDIQGGKDTVAHLVPTNAFVDAWQRNENKMLDYARKYCPMIVPPKPWTTFDDGGFYGDLAYFNSFFRLKGLDTYFGKAYVQRLGQLDFPDVFKAVNSLQATPWKINTQVLEVIKLCRANDYIPWGKEGKEAGYVLLLTNDNIPTEDATHMTAEQLKEYKKRRAMWYKNESRRITLQNRANSIINLADKFSKYERIYFPWNMDFRGRMYPIPSFSPQGDDLNKGLLLFADTPPCTSEKALDYLAITIANLAGVDKVSYSDRIAWTRQNEEHILNSAVDPMGYQWWLKQDKKPVQLLAACFEWKRAKDYMAEHNNSIIGFVTGLPYAQDGTCSGLQHFSAILRDPIGGMAVNLIPQDKPNDVYAQVAEKVNIKLKEDAMRGTADEWDDTKERLQYGTKTLAQVWLSFGVDRKVTKRPVMTFAYGAKKQGYIKQLLSDTIEPAMQHQKEGCVFTSMNAYQCAMYMANLIWDAVGETVVKATEGMKWLHTVAALVCKNASVVSWRTPLGLLLQQSYVKYDIHVVQLRCAGKRYRIYTPHQTGKIDKSKQTNGIAPNFIHSMDACHLQMTVCACKDKGINHFTMVHDSYGCPISQVEDMYKTVRECMVKLYTENDVLNDFKNWLQPLVDKPLPEPPPKGTLNLNTILDSEYIFC